MWLVPKEHGFQEGGHNVSPWTLEHQLSLESAGLKAVNTENKKNTKINRKPEKITPISKVAYRTPLAI